MREAMTLPLAWAVTGLILLLAGLWFALAFAFVLASVADLDAWLRNRILRWRIRRSLSEHEREAAPPSLLDRAAWRFVGFCAGAVSFYRWMRVR